MIHHVNSLLSPGTETSVPGNTSTQVSRNALQSFQNALSDAASSTGATFPSDPNAGQVSNSPAGATTTPASASSTQSGPPNGGYDPFAQAAYDFATETAGTATPASSSTTAAASSASTPSAAADPTLAFDNAYWASQPAPVQALRTMQSPEERADYAQQLASEGYLIDVPIMVWGWDPSIVTSMRQAAGYTWVPSAGQNPVEVAPGLGAVGNLAAYDPNNPPPGSIIVPPATSTAV
jgi:hypothetical protein